MGFVVHKHEFFIPFAEHVDVEEELKKVEEEILYLKGFLQTVKKKLSNTQFVNNAPAKVVDIERKKQADAEEKLLLLEEKLKNLKQ